MKVQKDDRILDHHLVDETILLGEDGADCLVACTLENCSITVDSIDHTNRILGSRLQGCTLEFKRKLKNTKLFSNDFIGCTFKGKFSGVDFGRSPRPDPLTKEMDERGDLIDCDFAQATLDLCRFTSVDLSRQRFAPWPQFVIPQVHSLEATKRQITWPGRLATFLQVATQQYSQVTALSGTVTGFKKSYAVTEEELVQALDDIGGVIR